MSEPSSGASLCGVICAAGLVLVGLGAVSHGCKKDAPESGNAPVQVAPGAPSPASADDADADDAVTVLRAYWPIGLQAAQADSKWSTCHDETKGYDPYLKCLTEAYTLVFAANRRLDDAPHASRVCGKEIETAHRDYLAAQLKLFDDRLKWTKAARAELVPRMAAASIWDACQPDGSCKGQPIAGVAGEPATDYSRIMNVGCTKTLFRCDKADNVCWINKVAARLGLGPDKPGGTLFVHKSGRVLN